MGLDCRCEAFGDANWDGVADLSHGGGAAALEDVVPWEGLQKRGLMNGVVPHASIWSSQHVLAAWYAVDAGLERLGRLVKRAPGVTRVGARAAYPDVIGMDLVRPSFHGIG